MVVEVSKIKKAKSNQRPKKLGSETDDPWKEFLNKFFKDFIEFVRPDIYKEIDWSQKYEIKEQELHAILGYGKKGKRYIDKLVKVKRIIGDEAYVLVHAEVQQQKETGFEKRVYDCHYRIAHRYRIPVVTLCVFIDDKQGWNPHVYEYELWDCKLKFQFPYFKLLELEPQYESLLQSENPFALLAYCQLTAIRTCYDVKTRYNIKFSIYKLLLKKKWLEEIILCFLNFLDSILKLTEDYEVLYDEEIRADGEELGMKYINSHQRIAMKKAEQALVLLLLEKKFHGLPDKYKDIIYQANSEILNTWAIRLLDAKTIEEVFSEH